MPQTEQFKLIIEDDEGRRSVVPIDLGEVSIGRLTENTICLNERNVSRKHARLSKDNGSVFAEDLGSYNGVWVNGDRIAGRHEIKEGDLIRIGDFHLEVKGDGLARRTEETTQRTLMPERETTQPEFRMEPGDEATPVVPPLAPEKPAGSERQEATAIIRLDAAEASATAKSSTTIAGERAKLVCVSTQLAGREFDIGKTEVVLGRTDENDIVIDHRSVSRQHAKIVRGQNGRYQLVDLKSANGTLVNGEEYAQTELKRGDLIELGHVKLRFVPPGESYALSAEEAAAAGGSSAAVSSSETVVRPTPLAGRQLPVVPLAVGGGIVLLLLVLLLLFTGGGDENGKADTTLADPPATEKVEAGSLKTVIERAKAALAQRHWSQAEALADEVLSADPKHADALALKKRAKLESKAQANYEQANDAIGRGQWQKAQQALQQVPPDSAYHQQALPLFEQVRGALGTELASEARAALASGDLDAAGSAISQLNELDPKHGELAALKRELERARESRSGRTAPAKKTSAKIERQPERQAEHPRPKGSGDARSAHDEGVRLIKAGEVQGAIDAFNQCIQLDASFGPCYRALGIAYARGGNGAKAARYYKQYLKVSPNAPDADQVRKILEQYESAP